MREHTEIIAEKISEYAKGEDDIPDDIRVEISKIEGLADRARCLDEDFEKEAKLTYTRMDALHEAIVWSDGILREKGRDKLVLDVLRRHLQEVLAAINKSTAAERGGRRDESRQDNDTSFGDLLDMPLEMREQRFMETYFGPILWRVVPTDSTSKGDEEEVSGAIHDDIRRARAENGRVGNAESHRVGVRVPTSTQSQDSQQIPSPGLAHRNNGHQKTREGKKPGEHQAGKRP